MTSSPYEVGGALYALCLYEKVIFSFFEKCRFYHITMKRKITHNQNLGGFIKQILNITLLYIIIHINFLTDPNLYFYLIYKVLKPVHLQIIICSNMQSNYLW